jgi:regulator of replication initiation timing
MGDLQEDRRALARDFVTLKHTIAQLRADRDRLAVENRDLQMRLAAIETDYANLFSYVEGSRAEA